jgi:hypothetical protein
MVKILIAIAACFLGCATIFAQNQVELGSWLKASESNLMRNTVLVLSAKKNRGYPKVQPLVNNEFFKMIDLQQPSVENSELFFLVNELKPSTAIDAAKILKTDYVFEESSSGTKITHVASGKEIQLPRAKNAQDYYSGLSQSFGFDGYVVDEKDGMILVKHTKASLEVGSQAVVLDSMDPFINNLSQVNGTYIVEMVETSEDFSIFKLVIGDPNKKIPTFAKIQFAAR